VSELRGFRPDVILGHLLAQNVRFVIVGGLAAQVHGSPSLTRDVDICYDRELENLQNMAVVLEELVAIRRAVPADVPPMPPLDARTLRAGNVFTLSTSAGDLDLLAMPDPGFDYERLRSNAIRVLVAGQDVLVASLDDLIAMKRAAGRPKDRIELEILGALREELDSDP
jgi:predicted nucleotidyltransferase